MGGISIWQLLIIAVIVVLLFGTKKLRNIGSDLGGAVPKLEDQPWPAFPADVMSIAIVTATQCEGIILMHEKMFESRMFFVDKLIGMGARIRALGAPIPRETLDLMFEPLRRGGVADADSEHASLGLGLFIVTQIAQAHGGTIRAESDAGVTTFCLRLPHAAPAAA